MKKVSVVIPVYNTKKEYLDTCIQSVLNQDYAEIEIIIVDDGSNDETKEILDNFSGEKIKVIHKKNGGVSSARNIGIKEANGDFITFVDSDDEIPHGYVSFLTSIIGENDIASVYPYPIESSPSFSNETRTLSGEEMLDESIRDYPHSWTVWGKLFRTEFIRDAIFNENIRVTEDSLFLFECATRLPNEIISEAKIYGYRQTVNSASRSEYSEKYEDILKASEIKTETVLRDFPQYSKQAKNIKLKSYITYFNTLIRTNYDEKSDKYKNTLNYIQNHSGDYLKANFKSNLTVKMLCKTPKLYIAIYKLKTRS